MTAVVRHATQDDFDALFDILIESHRGDLQRLFPYDRDKVKAIIERSTLQRGGITGVIDAPDKPGEIAGMVRLVLAEWEWSKCAFIQMTQLYIRPQYREGTRYTAALMDFAEGIRVYFQEKTPNQPVLMEYGFVNADPAKVRAMDRLFARWGKRAGTTYISGIM